MSRKIVRGAKLSKSDREYLASRPGGVAAYVVEEEGAPSGAEEDFSTFSGDSDGGSGPVEGEGEDPYLDWSAEDLREELKARDLPTTGKKAELVARLEESDRAEAS